MRDTSWTSAEKKAARAAFDLALERETAAARREVESRLAASTDADAIWSIHDYLSAKRREIQRKYDYRYSVLLSVFAQLVRDGWLSETELRGLAPDKLAAISNMARRL